MITMREIDAARVVVDTERAIFRNLRDTHRSTADAEVRVLAAERAVEKAIAEWVAQGCQDRGDLEYWRHRTEEAEAKLREVPCVVDEHLELDALPEKIATFIREVWGERNLIDPWERTMRVLEEAIEFAQAQGVVIGDVEKLAERVYARPHGVSSKEAGDIGITLLAWCYSQDVKLYDLMRRNHAEKIDARSRDAGRLREKQREKYLAGVGIDVEWGKPFEGDHVRSTCNSCHACEHGGHTLCGGVESGCGCAAEGHSR